MAKRRSTPADKLVGKRIRMLRVERHLSQQRLAEAIGVTFQQVQKYESGTNRIATGRLLKIAEAFKLPVETILSGLTADVVEGSSVDFALTLYEARLLKAYRSSGNEQRQLILQLAESFAKLQWSLQAGKLANNK